MISSPNRDRCTASGEPELFRDELGIEVERRPGQRARAQRRHVEAAARVEETVDVT
jgi:hypothetical protein